MRLHWWFVFCLLVIVGVLGAVIVHAGHEGAKTRARIAACHRLGPEFHYWQDRNRCVQYVTPLRVVRR